MIISHKYNTIFIHIPKCAGTAVRNMLTSNDPDAERMWGWRWLPRHQRYGDSAHIPLVDHPPRIKRLLRNYTVFTVVREPYDRFASAMNQHFFQHKYRERVDVSTMLDELTSTNIRYDVAYTHFCPQHYFTHIHKKRLVDHVFRLGDPEWMDKLVEMLVWHGFDREKLAVKRMNDRSEDKPEISPEDRRRIYKLYKRDFEIFGFEPGLDTQEFTLDADALPERSMTAPHDFAAHDRVHFMDANFRRS